mmetsp:Transcript_28850/g.43568  ORF Transcript_28850/g.43568 Transcript_28850/m.43568 type:complete len:245 (-) Transcript_28850:538-1272(-)
MQFFDEGEVDQQFGFLQVLLGQVPHNHFHFVSVHLVSPLVGLGEHRLLLLLELRNILGENLLHFDQVLVLALLPHEIGRIQEVLLGHSRRILVFLPVRQSISQASEVVHLQRSWDPGDVLEHLAFIVEVVSQHRLQVDSSVHYEQGSSVFLVERRRICFFASSLASSAGSHESALLLCFDLVPQVLQVAVDEGSQLLGDLTGPLVLDVGFLIDDRADCCEALGDLLELRFRLGVSLREYYLVEP